MSPEDFSPRVLLIYPPAFEISGNIGGRSVGRRSTSHVLSLGYLAGAVRDLVDCTILDLSSEKDPFGRLAEVLRTNDYQAVGISAIVFNIRIANRLSELVQEMAPGVPVILGGSATVFPREFLVAETPSIPWIVFGEGEMAFRSLMKDLVAGRKLSVVPGTVARVGSELIDGGPTQTVDLDELEYPWDAFDSKGISIHPPYGLYPPSAPYETSRGCVFNCRFCTIPKKYRTRSITRCIDELETLSKRKEIREVYFTDPTFSLEHERTIQFSEELAERDLDLHWSCKTRVDCLNPDLLRAMRKAGCYQIAVGVESGSQKILDAMRKGTNRSQVADTIKLCREAGINTVAYLVVGYPGETDQTVRRSVDLLNKARPTYVSCAAFVPTHIDDPGFWEYWDFFFTSRLHLTPVERQIRKWIRRIYFSFYLRPALVPVLMAFVIKPGGGRQLLSAAKEFIRKIVRT